MYESSETDLVKADVSALASITKGEVDMQVSTAKAYPRSIDRVIKSAVTLATIDQKTAESCFYTVPQGDDYIEGPSVRLAEIMSTAWTNLRCEARNIKEGTQYVTAQATVWDMENNVLVRIEVNRRIVDRCGNRYKQHMILNTQNAATSIALRNAVFRVIPRAIVDRIYSEARKVALGNAMTINQRRTSALKTFGKMGVNEERILIALKKPSIEDINVEDLSKLLGLLNAIKDGAITIEGAFPKKQPQDDDNVVNNSKSRTDDVLKKISNNKPVEKDKKTEKPNDKKITVSDETEGA